MQFIIRLSLAIILGLTALSLVGLILFATIGYTRYVSTSSYFKSTTCADVSAMVKNKDAAAVDKLVANMMRASNPGMGLVDEELKASEATLRDIIGACFAKPQATLYSLMTASQGPSMFDRVEDIYNVEDGEFQARQAYNEQSHNQNESHTAPDIEGGTIIGIVTPTAAVTSGMLVPPISPTVQPAAK